jgi:hypothetical protein
MRAENLLCRRARVTYAVSESLGSDHRRSFLWPIRPLPAPKRRSPNWQPCPFNSYRPDAALTPRRAPAVICHAPASLDCNQVYVNVSEPAPPRHSSLLKTPVSIAPHALDFRQLIGRGETVGWAEATAEPLFLTRLLDAQAERCSPFRVFFPLTFSDSLAAGHPNVTVTALGGAGAGRRFFARGADNVMPANISDVMGRSEGREVIGGSALKPKVPRPSMLGR